MDDIVLWEQAEATASLMIGLIRRLFVLEQDPAAELPLTQLRVCGILGSGPRSMSTLSRELGVSLSAMTQIADRLERAGLVTRVTEERDRRIRCLQLTPHGERIVRRREKARVQRVLAVMENLSPRGRKEVLAALEALMSASEIVREPGTVDCRNPVGQDNSSASRSEGFLCW